MTYLFLDDIRMPEQAGEYMPVQLAPMYRKDDWEIVRNYEEFVDWILVNGLPDVVSFDHDLADVQYNPDTWTESFHYHEKTGYDCAKWMVDFCMHEHLPLPECYVHSQNVVGAENIAKYLNNFKLHQVAEKVKSDEAKDFGDRSSTSSTETICSL